jgi:hypothetical protein
MAKAWHQLFMVLVIFSKNELFLVGWCTDGQAGDKQVSFAHCVIEIHDTLSE